jgi:hypothetical protein
MNDIKALSTEYFDIVIAADSITLMGEERGYETWQVLRPRLQSLPCESVMILDMSEISMLDYKFSQSAFGPLFASGTFHNSFHRVLFSLPNSVRNSFFEGILKANGHPTKSFAESEKMFAEAGLHCKIAVTKGNSIDFVGNRTPGEESVLKAVNQLRQARLAQLVDPSGLRIEDVVDNLRSLAAKGFVMEQQKADNVSYCSYYQFLDNMEASDE